MSQAAQTYRDLLAKAIRIANAAHDGQSNKTGGPFIDHVRRVAEAVSDDDGKLVAWLHDVVEKSPRWSLGELRSEGFPENVVEAVDAMSKRDGEDYLDFVRRSVRNPLARPVKRADLMDNLAQMRQIGDDGAKYMDALRLLEEEWAQSGERLGRQDRR
jgi:(p)ppGpp synthase/HD superfamily hydrolase